MENLMSNEEILEEIRKYSNPNYMLSLIHI